MGAIAVRPITRTDFVTPPEFADFRLADDPTGRIGGLDLELVDEGHGVRLGRCYQQIPLRVLPPFRFADDQPGLLYLINPTAGLFDGDGHLVRLRAKKGSRTLIVGQSATRIHPSLRAFSTQQWEISVEAGASLVVLPGPTIPFAGCRSFQRVTVDLAEGARFAWGDIGLPGRYARGADSERFRFETLIQQFEVRRRERRARLSRSARLARALDRRGPPLASRRARCVRQSVRDRRRGGGRRVGPFPHRGGGHGRALPRQRRGDDRRGGP